MPVMNKMFVTLPVKSVLQSMEFFQSLGYQINQQFTDQSAVCIVFGETNYAMLVSEAKWQEIVPCPISDTAKGSEVVIGITCETKEEVKQLVAKALRMGAKRLNEPEDYGFMYQDAFQDRDGHLWNFIWMDNTN